MSDAIYIQRAINEAVAGLQQQARIMAGIKLLAHSSIVAQIQAGNQMINADDPALAQGVRYLEAPPRSEVLVQTLDDNVQALYAVYGLNEMLSGAENVKAGTSAKSIAYLNKLDSMKMAGASRSLQKAIIRLCRQTLKLFQQYVQAPRLAQIAGDQGEFAAEEFIGADLAGVDVKLESASALEQMRGQIAGDAVMQQQAGNPDPALGEIAATGIKDTSYAKASRDIVLAQAEAALQGQPQTIDQEVDANVAVQTLIQIWASNHQNPQAMALLELLRGYQAKVTQAQVQPELAAGGEQ